MVKTCLLGHMPIANNSFSLKNKSTYPIYQSSFNFIINQNQIIYLKNKNIDINYLTIHKSKGLEADNVIIINLYNKTLGFPNKMKNDKLLRFVTKTKINYPYDEERRLFYVALTRTKEKLYLFTPINSCS